MKRLLLFLALIICCSGIKPFYQFYVRETLANGSTIGTMHADTDAGETITYSIVAGNTSNTFKIGSLSGTITVINAKTFRTKKYFVLTIKAVDSSPLHKWATATATITVMP